MRDIRVAIDGYSSCGKSTVARDLAGALSYAYIDTGAMYRAFTLYCLDKGVIQEGRAIPAAKIIPELLNVKIEFKHNDLLGTTETYLNGVNVEEEIRTMRVSE